MIYLILVCKCSEESSIFATRTNRKDAIELAKNTKGCDWWVTVEEWPLNGNEGKVIWNPIEGER